MTISLVRLHKLPATVACYAQGSLHCVDNEMMQTAFLISGCTDNRLLLYAGTCKLSCEILVLYQSLCYSLISFKEFFLE